MGLDNTSLVAKLLDGYLAGLAKGNPPTPEALLAEHPEAAEAIKACMASLNWLNEAANQEASPAAENRAEADHDASSTLGDFRLLREIGRGGMGVVYEAEQLSLGRRVALKVLPFAGMLDPRQRQRFLNEAHAAAQLNHPNIIDVISVGCQRGVHYYAMRLVDGPTLADVVTVLRSEQPDVEARAYSSPHAPREGNHRAERDAYGTLAVQQLAELKGLTGFRQPAGARGSGRDEECGLENAEAESSETLTLPVSAKAKKKAALTPALPQRERKKEALKTTAPIAALSTSSPREYFRSIARLMVDVAQALDYAHQSGVIHRDIKPSNLIVDAQGKVWVTDFGLARLEANPELTMTGDLLGTLRYMSPEQASGSCRLLDHRTDVYSLGALLYELLTLRPMFNGEDRQQLLRQIAEEEPPAPRKIARSVPVDLETIALKASEKEPSQRYATAGAMADDLGRFLDNKPIHARPVSARERLVRWTHRHVVLLYCAGASLIVALAIAILTASAVYRSNQQKDAAIDDANQQRKLAQARRDEADEKRIEVELGLARATLEHGLALCDQGEIGEGMLLLAKSLEITPSNAVDLQSATRRNLAFWSRQIHRVRQQIECPEIRLTASAAFRPDGARFAVAFFGEGVWVWETTTGAVLGKFAEGANLTALEWSPDGSRIATAERRNSDLKDPQAVIHPVRVWDAESFAPIGKPMGHQAPMHEISFSPDGGTLVTATNGVHLWNSETGDSLEPPPFLAGRGIFRARFSPDGAAIFLARRGAGLEPQLELWDVARGLLLHRLSDALPTHARASSFNPPSFSHDSKYIAISTGASGYVFETATGALLPPLPLAARSKVAFCADNHTIVTHDRRLFDVRSSDQIGQPLAGFNSGPVATNRHSSLILSVQGRRAVMCEQAPGIAPCGPLIHPDTIQSIAFSDDGLTAMTGTGKQAHYWDARTGAPKDTLALDDAYGYPPAFSPDGSFIAYPRRDGSAAIVKLGDGAALLPPIKHVSSDGLNVALSPDGRLIAIGNDGGGSLSGDPQAFQVCRISTGEPVISPVEAQIGDGGAALKGRERYLFSQAGDRLMVWRWHGTHATVWSTETGEAIGPPLAFGHPITSADFRADGKVALVVSADGASFWNVETGQRLAFRAPPPYERPAVSLFSRDGRYAVVASIRDARVWDAQTFQQLPGFFRCQATRLAISDDGRVLFVSGARLSSRFYDFATRLPLGPVIKHRFDHVMFNRQGTRLLAAVVGEARLFEIPGPVSGTPRQVRRRVEALVGMKLSDDGLPELLTLDEWRERAADAD